MTNLTIWPIILAIIFFSWLALLTFLLWKTRSHYSRLTQGTVGGNLQAVLEKILTRLNDNGAVITVLKKELGKMSLDNLNHLQKIGFVRFNPFPETGGNQSFSLAVLDGKGNGVVLSSLHSRESTRIYAKTIKTGKAGNFDLSAEEKQAIAQAVKIKT